MNAILGGSESCVATHASDMCVALLALDAIVHIESKKLKRSIPIEDFHLRPGSNPQKESVLEDDELITEIEIPIKAFSKKSYYLKVRDRASYAFALCSAAVALEIEDGKIESCRLALGGVATKPWRVAEAEKILCGQKASEALFKKAAEAALMGAKTLKYNAFKVELGKRTLIRALKTAGALS
ncbi:MAG: FAD binding domain-containing protein [Candidatus Obscuribacterales bacterium]|nr:FAD binding domain-containing protein [Candidatus Obscuribacterales bacterium]